MLLHARSLESFVSLPFQADIQPIVLYRFMQRVTSMICHNLSSQYTSLPNLQPHIVSFFRTTLPSLFFTHERSWRTQLETRQRSYEATRGSPAPAESCNTSFVVQGRTTFELRKTGRERRAEPVVPSPRSQRKSCHGPSSSPDFNSRQQSR